MAFASVGSFGTANSTTSDTSLALTPTVTIEVGNLAMLVISADNVASGTSPNAEFGHKISNVSSVTDTGSNTWHKLGEVAGNQAAAGGNAAALYYCIITTQLTTSSTVTVTFGSAITSKAASGWEFTIGGSNLAVERIRFRADAATDPPSMTLDDLTSREYLFFRARASETDNTTWTATTNFTGITNATADAGAAGVGSSANGEFRIVTSTSQTSDPTKTSSDGADIFIALWEGQQKDASPWVVTGNTLQSGAGTTTPPWPLGHEVDDIALLVCESLNGEAVSLTTANGFAETSSSPQDVSASRLTLFWCRATSTSMASPVTNDPGDHISNHMYLIRGCHNSGNPWDVITGNTGASSTSVTCPEVTTTVARCLILWICSQGSDVSTDEFSGWANSGSTRFEELDAISVAAGNGGGHGIAYGYKASAGATGTATATLATASGQGRITIAFKPQSGQTVTANQATETDTSQPVSKIKNKAVGQNLETDLSQALTRIKNLAIGQNLETDLAQAIARVKIVVVNQITETDLAQVITVSGNETIVPVNQVSETDLAQAINEIKIVTLGQNIETDLAQSISRVKIYSAALVTETDLSQSITVRKIIVVNQVTESDLSQAIAKSKTKSLIQISELDIAQPIVSGGAILVQQVNETDLAQQLFPLKRVAVVQVIETDLVQVISADKIRMIGQTTETDLAQSLVAISGFGSAPSPTLVPLTLFARSPVLNLSSRSANLILDEREKLLTVKE